MNGYDDDNDGGLRYWAEVGQWEPERDTRLLEEYSRWRAIFESGLKTTNAKNADNETNNERTT